MEHHIKIKIADRIYTQKIHSEEEEEAIRSAAAAVNEKINRYGRTYAAVSVLDLLTIVALNEGIESFQARKELEAAKKEAEMLSADLKNYVESLK